MFKYLNNKKGSALIWTLIVMVVLVILTAALLNTALADTKMAVYQENSMKSYFIARSGAYTLADYIIKTPSVVLNSVVSSLVSAGQSNEEYVGDGSFVLDVTQSGSDVIIKSTGDVNGVEQEVSVVLEMSAGAIFDYAIVAIEKINLKNHVEIVGGVATNSKNKNDVSAGNGTTPQEDDIILNAGFKFKPIITPYSYNFEFSNTITSTDVINISGETHILAKKGVDLSTNNNMNIVGTGDLHLYVYEKFDIGNHSEIINNNGSIYIYILDSTEVKLNGSIIKAIIYAPHSKVDLHNASGGGRVVFGSVIAKEVHVHNNALIAHNKSIDPNNISLEKSYVIKGWK